MSKTTKAKIHTTKSARRREELRRNLPKPALGATTLLKRPEFVNGGLLLLIFIILTSILVIWSRDRIKVEVDQIMLQTRLNRLDYTVEDVEATQAKREEAATGSPRVYRLNRQYLEELQYALNALPKAVEGKTKLDEINPKLVNEYRLTEAGLAALQPYVAEGETSAQWQNWVTWLIRDELRRRPLLGTEEYQKFYTTLHRALLSPDDNSLEELTDDTRPIELDDALTGRFEQIVRRVGFPPEVAPFVEARLEYEPRPTFIFDPETTETLAAKAAKAVEPVMITHRRGDVIYRRGERLTASQKAELQTEQRRYQEQAGITELWLPRLGIVGLIGIVMAFAGSFILTSYPRVMGNTLRQVAIGVLMVAMLGVTIAFTARWPDLLYPAAIGPTLLVTMIVLLSYDQRLALFLSIVQCALVALAVEQGVGWFVLLIAGCGTMIVQLRQVRHRNSLIRAALVTAAVLGVGTILYGLLVSPMVEGIWLQIVGNAAWAVAASIMIGFLVLGILPSIERLFDITTGMTLAELRDPSQPLLRQLQQRAPGTYNHSLQVANIAEAAADAIGADSLLVYVGALYHDIGKMNKPEYFVENQSDGFNKHSKLRPAMSLLVIIGHVKDGIELAREYGLPRAIQHFIESHHGTTLVEYFYHAAKTQAQIDQKSAVDEVEFRYPGPKPRSREAAILMLADAVESATRAMAEPNPSRIESLVRELSRKRLLDDQFDESDLSFRELSQIEDAMIARLCAIHHGRISYPATRAGEPPEPGPRTAEPVTA
jgi:putative nucleotidyltransferase with HDIG domain